MILRSRAVRWSALALAAVVAAGAGYLALNSDAPPRAAAAADGLTWSDDFTGPAGGAPDAGKWTHDTGGDGWGNSELEYYTNSAANAALDGDGHLVITARAENPAGYDCWYGTCRYTSARLITRNKFAQAYGRFEARIKLPRGQGIWPAFWMLGNNLGRAGWPASGEIDVMENLGSEPGTVHGSLHGPGYSAGDALTGSYTLPGGQAFADGFHTFAVSWSPASVTFSVDGAAYETQTRADAEGHKWVFDHPFFILLNVAVGGNWPGAPDAGTSFPQQMIVDYVHVYAS